MNKHSDFTQKFVAFAFLSFVTLLLQSSPSYAAQQASNYLYATRYNEAGQVTGTIAPDADGGNSSDFSASRYTYDSASGLLRSTEAGYLNFWQDETVAPSDWNGFIVSVKQQFFYDSFGRKSTLRIIDSSGNIEQVTQYSYDTKSRLMCQAVRMNPDVFHALPSSACTLGTQGDMGPDRITKYEYDGIDQVTIEWRALGTELEQKYVERSYTSRLLNSMTDANGNKTELKYDAYGRLQKRIYPSKTVTGSVNTSDYNTYSYDANGNLTSERKRSGAVITYQYDKNNRRIKKDLSGTTQDVYYAYDLRGLTLYSRFASTSGKGITNTFDGFGNLSTATTNMSGTARKLTYTYDNNSNRTKVTHPNGIYAEYYFDQLNRAYRIRSHGSTSIWVNYDAQGRRTSLERNVRRDGVKTNYGFDNLGRLVSLNQNFSGTVNDLTNSFTYTPSNQIASVDYSNDQYYYFGNENRTGDYIANGLNQYTNISGKTLSYDANGNLINDGFSTYSYDVENRLTSVSGSDSANFSYDPLGRLSQTTINGTTRYFLYDGDALISEYSSSSSTTPVNCYIHGDQVDEPLIQFNGACSNSFTLRRLLHSDHQGSIIAHSNTSGELLAKNTYDNYGIPGLENYGRFGYTGQIWFEDLGLYHYKARMYSPTLGRFLQTDPIGYDDDMNMYAYVGNDPVNYVDPNGEFGIPINSSQAGYLYGQGMSARYYRSQNISEEYIPSKATVRKVANITSLALVIGSLSPCSLYCAAGSLSIDSAMAADYVSEGNYTDAALTLVPGVSGEAIGAAAKASKLVSSSKASAQGVAATVIANQTISAGSDQSQIGDNSNNQTKRSDQGMSGGGVTICSGMGAKSGGC